MILWVKSVVSVLTFLLIVVCWINWYVSWVFNPHTDIMSHIYNIRTCYFVTIMITFFLFPFSTFHLFRKGKGIEIIVVRFFIVKFDCLVHVNSHFTCDSFILWSILTHNLPPPSFILLFVSFISLKW